MKNQPALDRGEWLRVLVLAGGVVLALIAQVQMHFDPVDRHAPGNWLLTGLGLAVFLIVGRQRIFRVETEHLAASVKQQRLHFRSFWLVISIGLIGFVTWRTVFSPEAHLFEHLLLWTLGLLTFVIAVSPRSRQTQKYHTESVPVRHRSVEWVLLVVLFIVAFMIRGINLEREPYLLDDNEALFALEGTIIKRSGFQTSPFVPGFHTHPRLYQSMIGLSVQFFGITKVGARLPTALLGALTIPAIYLLGKELRNWRAGLIAALFALTWAFHVEFSRLAMNQPADPLLGALAFYFLLRGLRRSSAVSFALSGLAVGVAQLFYLGGG